MNHLVQVPQADMEAIEALIINGDLSKLNPRQQMTYYRKRCTDLGLDPLSQPFSWLRLQGKLVLYLNRAGSEQLRKVHKVSVTVTDKKLSNDILSIYVRATTPDGRTEDECGSLSVSGKKGEELANAEMKAMTKAKRRATISICGLGMMDETEVENIPNAHPVPGPVLKEEVVSIPQEVVAPKVVPSPETAIPFGALKGKKLKDFSHDDWRGYVNNIRRAMENPEMPKQTREEAISVISLIESYLG